MTNLGKLRLKIHLLILDKRKNYVEIFVTFFAAATTENGLILFK